MVAKTSQQENLIFLLKRDKKVMVKASNFKNYTHSIMNFGDTIYQRLLLGLFIHHILGDNSPMVSHISACLAS